MSWYTVFNADTGKALRTFHTSHIDMIHIQAVENHEIILMGDYGEGYELIDGWPEKVASPKKVITELDVDRHLARLLSYTDWVYTRERETGKAPPEDILAERVALRETAKKLEKMKPIPDDYQHQKYWIVD